MASLAKSEAIEFFAKEVHKAGKAGRSRAEAGAARGGQEQGGAGQAGQGRAGRQGRGQGRQSKTSNSLKIPSKPAKDPIHLLQP